MSSTSALLALVLILLNTSCSVNILESFADKNTPEARYVAAKKKVSAKDYSGALAEIALITGSLASDRKVIALKASAHAGLCGLEFLPFVEALAGLGTSRLFPVLMNHMRSGSVTTGIDNCIDAEELLESIGTTAQRTSDENMMLVLVAFAKIGEILSFYADSNQDGTVTAAYNACTVGGSRTAGGGIELTDSQELAWSVVSAINNITAVTSTVDLGDAALADISAACTLLGSTLGAGFNFCAVTDKTAFTGDHLKGLRSLLKEDNAVGLGGNCSGDISTCNCP